MPTGQPFTALCRRLLAPAPTDRADLHLHSTHSDGDYTPAQLVDLARRAGLRAIALTDHDTLAGLPDAQAAASHGAPLEIVPGVEISCDYEGRELHLLAYFVRPDDPALGEALARLAGARATRFWDMVDRLHARGVRLDGVRDDPSLRDRPAAASLGRRHLAAMLVRERRAGTVQEAFRRWLADGGPVCLPKVLLPAAEALALVQAAGGVAAHAHPAYDCTRERLAALRERGLGAVEAAYPAVRPARAAQLRTWAAELGLAVTGGSDCHGPEPARRTVGACTATTLELETLRRRAGRN